MQLIKLKYSPLLYLDNGEILAYKYGIIYMLDRNHFGVQKKVSLPLGWKEKYLSRINIISRLLRLGIRNAYQLNEEEVIVFVNKRFFEYNIKTTVLEAGYVPPAGVRALNIVKIEDIFGFDNMIVFGGYLSNRYKTSVDIYRRINCQKWEPIFRFNEGLINHIHNIIPDKDNKCVWIMTGDFDKAATIWKATKNFENVVRITNFGQEYRSCIGFPYERRLLYATDSPFHSNSIRLLEENNGVWESKAIYEISGSCIYGCKIGDRYVFSTVVEPDGHTTGLKSVFVRKRGSGIKDNFTHLYIGDPNNGFREIYKAEKDIWLPIFQFGALKFPTGENDSTTLLIEHIATKKYDCKTIGLKINNINV